MLHRNLGSTYKANLITPFKGMKFRGFFEDTQFPRKAVGTMLVPKYDYCASSWMMIREDVKDIDSNLRRLERFADEGIWGNMDVQFDRVDISADQTVELIEALVYARGLAAGLVDLTEF